MNTPEQKRIAGNSIALGLFRIAASPLVVRTVLFFLLFLAIILALVFGVGIPMRRLWLFALLLPLFSVAFAFRTLRSRIQSVTIEGPKVYDKAEYHYDGDFPKGLSRKQAFVHTGMLVGWLIEHGMIAKDFLEETQRFKERRITGAQVYKAWDGSLIDYMLTDEGNAFAKYYYDGAEGQGGRYFEDYETILAKDLPSIYHVKDTWENYETIKKKIDERYETWKKSNVA